MAFVSSGSSGVRGITNDGFDAELALHMGKLVGMRYGGVIAVASDTRPSGEMLKSAVSAGIMSAGADVVDLGSMPTPALQYYVKTHPSVDGGAMVTASHNPPEFNGVKAISAEGLEDPFLQDLSVDEIKALETSQVPWAQIGEKIDIEGYIDEYVDAVVSLVDREAIAAADLKVCVECSNGSAQNVVPMILRKLGVQMIVMNNNTEGELTGHDSELTAANLLDLGYMTRKTGCSFGAAFDMDADRCLFTDEKGDMVLGDKSLAILARSLLEERKGKIVTSVASSSAIEEFLEEYGGIVKYVSVGAPNIVRKVIEYDALFGGEVNGGIVFPKLQYCRDAQMALAQMLECVARYGPLSEQTAAIPTYSYFNATLDCADDRKDYLVAMLKEDSAGNITDITDGIKVFYDDGWVLARPSATGPYFRIYSQANDAEVARNRLDEYIAKAVEYLAE